MIGNGLVLRITATDGTCTTVATGNLQHFHQAALSGSQPYRAPRITSVTYFEYVGGTGQGATMPTIATVAAYTGANDLYEIGVYTSDGIFLVIFSNRS